MARDTTTRDSRLQSYLSACYTLRAHDAGFKLTGCAHRSRTPPLTAPKSGASRLRRSLPPDGYRSGSGLFADIGLDAHWPGDIGSLCRHWPLCPLAWGPRPAPGLDRAWFYPRCSPGLDALRRKSTRPLWDTWLEVTRMLLPAAAPSTGRQPDSRVTQIRGGPTLAHLPLCQLAWWRPL